VSVKEQHRYREACQYLASLKSVGVTLGLGRMERLMEKLGRPDERVAAVHIAGTNGKGSVAAMMETIFRQVGWKTGLYTSPHLVRLGERIQVNRSPLTEADLVIGTETLGLIVEEMKREHGDEAARPSYFEFMTALAFWHFERSNCDISVIEVGLGGRLDATNIVSPELSVITSIGLDHTELLGDTLAKIAAEKAGIIKPNTPVVIGYLPQEAESVIRAIAADKRAPLFSTREKFGNEPSALPPTNLVGDYQRRNAATATLAAEVLAPHWKLNPNGIAAALLQVDWAGRWQRFAVDDRTVILDCSHNAEGMTTLAANLDALEKETGRRPVVIAGALGLARGQVMVEVIATRAKEIFFVQPAQRRATPTAELLRFLPEQGRVPARESSVAALFPSMGVCRAGRPGDVVVVTGSMYLAGEVLARLEPKRGPYEGDLQDF
jgi:dihydrofolate synthase/folylpolyglutamate synthase